MKPWNELAHFRLTHPQPLLLKKKGLYSSFGAFGKPKNLIIMRLCLPSFSREGKPAGRGELAHFRLTHPQPSLKKEGALQLLRSFRQAEKLNYYAIVQLSFSREGKPAGRGELIKPQKAKFFIKYKTAVT